MAGGGAKDKDQRGKTSNRRQKSDDCANPDRCVAGPTFQPCYKWPALGHHALLENTAISQPMRALCQ